jgi:HPt (histidine-containing phosphotransfer) domain-containing protein
MIFTPSSPQLEEGIEMVDWSRVEELAHDLGSEDFDEVFALFLEEVEEKLGGLAQSEQLSQDLHFLKGCAANLGFVSLQQACADAETNCTASTIAAVQEAYQRSVAEFNEGRAAHLHAA